MRVSPGTLLLGVVAVMFGLLGAYIVRENEKPPEVVEAPPETPRSIIVPQASSNLAPGRQITVGDITLTQMTPEQIRAAGLPSQFMSHTRDIIGRIVRQPMTKGEVFDTHLFYPQGTGPSLVDKLEPGSRAVTVKVDMDNSVEGFATPGTWVDVLFRSLENEEEAFPEMTVTLLEGVKVLAMNRSTNESTPIRNGDRQVSRDQATVTLSVTPQQAMALRVVEDRGTLALVLRHPDDIVPGNQFAGLTMDQLLNRPNDKHRIEVFRGHQISQVEFRSKDRSDIDPEALARDGARREAQIRPLRQDEVAIPVAGAGGEEE
ncbi:MAG: Flp pilus assembly protein CpaB [Pirellulaceae bacterium]